MVAAVQSPGRNAILLEDLTEADRRARQTELNKGLVALLQSWLDDDDETEEEQRVALEELKRGLDEHRTPGNKLYA